MVKFALQICGTLENVEVMEAEQPNYNYMIRYVCSACQYPNDSWHSLSLSREFEARVGRNKVHHRSRCKSCRRDATIMILPDTIVDYKGADTQNYRTIAVFDFRGVEPTDFGFQSGWTVKSVTGKKYEDCDLTTGDWVEFDVELKDCVSVVDLLAKFVKVD